MKAYELIIQRGQPSCGGQSPTRSEIMEIETDDVLQYVRAREKDVVPTVEQKDADTIVVSFVSGDGMPVKYEFTEA